MSTQDYTAPLHPASPQQQYPANVQLKATGQWFRIDRTEDSNGVVWLDVRAYERNEQIPFAEVSR